MLKQVFFYQENVKVVVPLEVSFLTIKNIKVIMFHLKMNNWMNLNNSFVYLLITIKENPQTIGFILC